MICRICKTNNPLNNKSPICYGCKKKRKKEVKKCKACQKLLTEKSEFFYKEDMCLECGTTEALKNFDFDKSRGTTFHMLDNLCVVCRSSEAVRGTVLCKDCSENEKFRI